jgi:hypothetical protein
MELVERRRTCGHRCVSIGRIGMAFRPVILQKQKSAAWALFIFGEENAVRSPLLFFYSSLKGADVVDSRRYVARKIVRPIPGPNPSARGAPGPACGCPNLFQTNLSNRGVLVADHSLRHP